MQELFEHLKGKKLIAIEGEPGSGKSTLAAYLSKKLDAIVVSIDDFYQPLDKRNADTFKRGGNNIDFERLIEEVVKNHLNHHCVNYQKYNCQTGNYTQINHLMYKPTVIIEGSYTFREEIIEYFDYKILLHVNEKTQKERLKERKNYNDFLKRWIPLSRNFIQNENIDKFADFIIKDIQL